MKHIRKLLALVLACLTLVLALPSAALAANRGEPAGYVSQVNSAFTMPKPGQALPTAATNYVADTIVTATWEPSGNVAVDQTYTCKVRLVLGDGDGYPIYVYAQTGYIDIGINYPSGHYESLISQSFADNPSIAWQIDQNYVSNPTTWVWGTVNYSLSVTPYHSINYNANGGTITSTGYPTYVADGDSVSQSSLPTAKKTGYVFKGWEWDYDKGLILGNLSSMLSAVYGPVYLKAVWETEPVNYTLSYNANGGSGSMASQTVTEGQSTKLKTNTFMKSGYTFAGWNTRADGSGTSYSDGAYATFYGNTTLYAQWQKYADPVITFDKNDGSGTTVSQTVPYGSSATLNANSFTRTGYAFSDWNTKADGSGTAYGDGASISPSSNMTLYAQWAMAADYTVLLPDGDNITVDPETKVGSAEIGIQAGSTIPEDKQLQMSVNAGRHYDEDAQCYRLLNGTGGQLLFYVLAYKGNEVNPGNAQGGVLLETASSDAVFAGFQNRVSVTVGTARTAGRYTDTLTFRFALV